jgi:hypothetical protein
MANGFAEMEREIWERGRIFSGSPVPGGISFRADANKQEFAVKIHGEPA